MIPLQFTRVVTAADDCTTINALGMSVFPVLEKIPPCITGDGTSYPTTFGLKLLDQFPSGRWLEALGHTNHPVYVNLEDAGELLEYEYWLLMKTCK